MRTTSLVAAGFAVLLILSGIVGAAVPGVMAQTATTDEQTETPADTDQPSDGQTDRAMDSAERDVDRWAHVQVALNLSDERVEELRDLVTEERDQGADKREIRRTVLDALEDDGYDRTEIKLRLVTYRVSLHFDLDESQTTDLLDQVSEDHDAGMAPREVLGAMFATLEEWGYDTSDVKRHLADRVDDRRKHAAFHEQLKKLQIRYDLTDEQTRLIHAKVHEMHEDGASKAEMKRTVKAMVERFTGHEVDTGRDTLERYLDHLQYRYHLTTDEVNDLRHLAEDMHEDGYDRAEIRETLHRTAAAMEG